MSVSKKLSFAPQPKWNFAAHHSGQEAKKDSCFEGYQEYYMGKENKLTERNAELPRKVPLSDDC